MELTKRDKMYITMLIVYLIGYVVGWLVGLCGLNIFTFFVVISTTYVTFVILKGITQKYVDE